MKVIFLDVDGELTYCGYSNTERRDIDPDKVKLLKNIVDKTGAIIVLSSSWRTGYNKETGEKRSYYIILEQCLAEFGLEIYDIIPDVKQDSDGLFSGTLEELMNVPVNYEIGRSVEIQQWLNENNDVESYVILDDEDFHWEHFNMHKNWIQPSWYDEDGGLHQEHVDKAIEILMR